jgi:hypothetical protein
MRLWVRILHNPEHAAGTVLLFIIVDEIIEIRYLERFISGLTLEDRSW